MKGTQVNLTKRELEVLHLCANGKSNNEIATSLMISQHTAKAHVCNVLEKLETQNRVCAVIKAMKNGLIK